MNSSFMVLKIRSVLLNPAPYWKSNLWINELNRFLENVGKTDNYITIPIGTNSDPTFLVFNSVSTFSFNHKLLSTISITTADPLYSRSLKTGCFNWKSGIGFSLSTNNTEVAEDYFIEKLEFPAYLMLEKYLLCLEKFNRSYDDDIFLNLVFCVKMQKD